MITFASKRTHTWVYTACIVLTAVGLLCLPELAFAQTATSTPAHVPLQKAIGQAKDAKPEVVPSLIVLNAGGASLQGQTLTLAGVAPNSIVFADRPVRSAGHVLTAHLLEEWGTGSDSFAKDPPNATVSVFSKDGSSNPRCCRRAEDPKATGRSVDVRRAGPRGRLGGRRWTRCCFHRYHRYALDTAVVRRRGAPHRGSRGLVWSGRLGGSRAVLPSILPAAASPYYRPPCGYYPYPPCY